MPGAASGTLVAGPCIVTRGMVGRPSMLRCLPCLTTVGWWGNLEFSGTQGCGGRIDGGATQHEGTGGVVAHKAVVFQECHDVFLDRLHMISLVPGR